MKADFAQPPFAPAHSASEVDFDPIYSQKKTP
jgi:hypothetical protein